MKRFLAAIAATTFLAGPAMAADLDPIESPALYRYYVQGDFLYGFGTIDRDADLGPVEVELEPDFELGGKIEAGVFLTDRIRVSGDLRLFNTDFDSVTVPGLGTTALDLDADTFQGFVNVAYEVALSDVGFTAPFFDRTSVFGIAGIGFSHTDFDLAVPGETDDTVLVGKVGLGSSYRFTENLSLVSETSFIFGEDLDIQGISIDAEQINSTIGLRFRF